MRRRSGIPRLRRRTQNRPRKMSMPKVQSRMVLPRVYFNQWGGRWFLRSTSRKANYAYQMYWGRNLPDEEDRRGVIAAWMAGDMNTVVQMKREYKEAYKMMKTQQKQKKVLT